VKILYTFYISVNAVQTEQGGLDKTIKACILKVLAGAQASLTEIIMIFLSPPKQVPKYYLS
jgi:hypothetical protein